MRAFRDLTAPLKVLIVLVAGGGIAGSAYFLYGGDIRVFWLLATGMVAIGSVLGGSALVRFLRSRRRGGNMATELRNTAGRTNTTGLDAATIGELEKLSVRFEEGVDEFQRRGKDLYKLPWYAVIGESRGGKTEMMRHCKVGFPSGMEKFVPGPGGTVNMNWWFTNHAVVLDTAGAMVIPDLEPGQRNQLWDGFLKLLVKHRRQCPLNGLLLVIPANSLITDTAEAIQEKASRYAQEMDHIQQVLGVRMPVYLVISKCDLISGFREYFDGIGDVDLQDQVFGWTNQATLDVPFDPDEVDQHLNSVRDQLIKRRLGLLYDPTATDPSRRRIDEVDELYEFPENLIKIVPRLRRYLEMVFVAGEWAEKPLFLRGIYFASSMQEGSPLDEALANFLSMDVRDVTGNRDFIERSFFLRDLFVKKVFKEGGLVSTAVNPDRKYRRQKFTILGTIILGIVAMIAFTIYGGRQLENSIGKHEGIWTAIQGEMLVREGTGDQVFSTLRQTIIRKPTRTSGYEYFGTRKLDQISGKADDEITLTGLLEFTREQTDEQVPVPWIFKPVQLAKDVVRSQGSLGKLRMDAHRTLVDKVLVESVVTAAIETLKANPNHAWEPVEGGGLVAVNTLAQILRMVAATVNAGGKPSVLTQNAKLLDLKSPIHFIFPDFSSDQNNMLRGDVGRLQKIIDWTYGADQAAQPWPPQGTIDALESNRSAIATAVSSFIRYWDNRVKGDRTQNNNLFLLSKLHVLQIALKKYHDAENALVQLDDGYASLAEEPHNLNHYDSLLSQWRERLEVLRKAKIGLDGAIAVLGDQWNSEIVAVIEQARSEIQNRGYKSYDTLLAETMVSVTAETPAPNQLPSWFLKINRRLSESREQFKTYVDQQLASLRKDLPSLNQQFLARVTGDGESGQHAYVIRYQLYSIANKASDVVVPILDRVDNTKQLLAKIRNDYDVAIEGSSRNRMALAKSRLPMHGDWTSQATAVSECMLRAAIRKRSSQLMSMALQALPSSANGFVQFIKQRARYHAPMPTPVIPFSEMDGTRPFDVRYHNKALGTLFESLDYLAKVLEESRNPNDVGVLNAEKLGNQFDGKKKIASEYLLRYVQYWTTVEQQSRPQVFQSWSQFQASMTNVNGEAIKQGLMELATTQLKALEIAMPTLSKTKYSPEAARKLAKVRKQLDFLKQLDNQTCSIAINAFKELGADSAAAVRNVLHLSASDFRKRHLGPYREESSEFGSPYFNSLCVQAVNLLMEASELSGQQARTELITDFKQFPLCRDQGGLELTPSQLQRAKQLIGRIRFSQLSTGGDRSIATGDRTNLTKKIDPMLDRICGSRTLNGYENWFEKVRKMLVFLSPGRLRCELYILPFAEQDVLPDKQFTKDQSLRHTLLKFSVNGTEFRTEGGVASKPTGVKWLVPSNDQNGIKFSAFRGTEDIVPVASSMLPGYWNALNVVRASKGKRDSAMMWRVPLIFHEDNASYFYWIGLRFSEPLPDKDVWPTMDQWPTP